MGKLPYTGTIKLSSVIVNETKPLDVRTVVSSVEDLTNSTIPNLYTGIIVNVKGTGDLYVLVSSPRTAHLSTSWKKVGVDVDLSDYVKFDDLPDYLTDSDLDDYAKKSDIPDVSNFADKNEIPSVEGLASKDWVEGKGYLTSHQSLDDYALKSEIPDVSNFATKSEIPSIVGLASEQWVENKGYLTANDLPDYLSDSDLDEYAKKSDIPSVEGLASQSWVEGQGYLTQHQDISNKADKSELPTKVSDLTNDEGYLTANDLPDYLTDSDLDEFAKKSDIPSVEGLASEQWVENKGYLTSHQSLDDYALKSEIPDVSNFATKSEIPSIVGLASEQWVGQQGYLTINDLPDYLLDSDLDDYALKSEIPDVSGFATKSEIPSIVGLASEQWVENKGYLTANDLPDYLSDSDLDDYALKSELPTAGSFPADSDIEDVNAYADGMATVQDVMDYVQAYFEKKKDELEDSDSDVPVLPYAYITGYGLNDAPTDITQFNEFVLNESGDTAIEIYAPQEFAAWDPSTNEDLPSVKLTVDIPDGYSVKNVYMWNVLTNNYELLTGSNEFVQNQRYTSRIINGVTYNSYVRGDSDPTATRGLTRYKIIITI